MARGLLLFAELLAAVLIAFILPRQNPSTRGGDGAESPDAKTEAVAESTPALMTRETVTRATAPRESTAPTVATIAEAAAPTDKRVAPLASAGMVVGIDPETGRLGPATPEQRARLGIDDAMPTSQQYATTRNADGSLTVHTRGLLREFFVVRMGPAGKAMVGCVDGLDAAKQALSNPAPAAALEDR